jgi:hypothetical protein
VFFIIALWSADSGVAALFDAFNVIYKEKERRSLLTLVASISGQDGHRHSCLGLSKKQQRTGLFWGTDARGGCGRPPDLAVVTARPHPGSVRRCNRHPENAADDHAVLEHVVVVVALLTGRVRSRSGRLRIKPGPTMLGSQQRPRVAARSGQIAFGCHERDEECPRRM